MTTTDHSPVGTVDLHKAADPEPDFIDSDAIDGELVPFDDDLEPWPVSPYRGPLQRFANRPLPTLYSTGASARWWAVTLTRAGLQIVMHSPQLLLAQVPPIFHGLATWAGHYARWRGQPEWMGAALVAEPKDRAKRVAEVKARQRAATRLTIAAFLALLGGGLAAFLAGLGHLLAAAAAAVLLAADIVGRRTAPPTHGIAVMPRSHFQEGAPVRMVVADIRAVLVENRHDPERLALVDPRVGEYGISVQVHSNRELDENDVSAIERGLQTYRGAVSVIGDPTNAAVTEVRAMWRDPLTEMFVPPRLEPNSQTVADPKVCGYGLGKAPLLLNFMRVNVLLVGAPGSGKSSALWAIIDQLSVCRDVVLHGIDLSGGPALRAWGEVFATRAFDREAAKKLLERNIARAMARTEILAARSEPSVDGTPPESENWTPDDGKFHITIIDELPLLASDPELVALYAEHQRIGRKAGDTSLAATQDLHGDTLGATSLRKYPSTLIMFACSREDVIAAMGGGAIRLGWTPHRWTAAEGDSPNDAGKAMVRSGRHTKPVPWRFARLDDMAEIHSRAIERIQAGRPTDDDPISAVVIPDILAAVVAAFHAAGDPDFMPTEDLVAALVAAGRRDMDANKLAAKLKPEHGSWRVTSTRPRVNGKLVRGYAYADVSAAVDGL